MEITRNHKMEILTFASTPKMTFRNGIDRLRFYEQSRRKSEAVYREHPLDAANLSRWGEALLELVQFDDYLIDCGTMVQDAISKLEAALAISPSSHETVWLLGTAYSTAAFLTLDDEDANNYFEKASQCFQKAVDLDPKNFNYTNSLEICPSAPFERDSWLRKNISECDSVGGHVKVPEQQAEIQRDMGSNQHISVGHVKVMLENLAVSDMM